MLFLKNKRHSIAIILLSASLFSQSTHAEIPNINITLLLNKLSGNLQRFNQFQEITQHHAFDAAMIEMNSRNLADAAANGASNLAIRSAQTEQEVQESELREKTAPMLNACESFVFSQSLDDLACETEDQTTSVRNKSAALSGGSLYQEPGSKNNTEVTNYIKNKVEKLVSESKANGESTTIAIDADNQDNPVGDWAGASDTVDVTTITPSPLVALGAFSSLYGPSDLGDPVPYSEKQKEAALDLIDLLAPPHLDTIAVDSTAVKYAHLRMVTLSAVPRETLLRILNDNTRTGTKPSRHDLIHAYAKPKFVDSNPESNMSMISASRNISAAQIYRKVAEMLAFQTYMKLDAYKKSLDRESVLATLVSIKLNRPPN
ncbi:hypothetical protein [Neptuniibacter sp. QD37_11]|uniref:hypothetical protein n=1 Tax=Neptuniibacter sp. QD37_11 TaxID=3398209 RepID=UPI0039F49460